MKQHVKIYVWSVIDLLGALAIVLVIWCYVSRLVDYHVARGYEIDALTLFLMVNYELMPFLAAVLYGLLIYARRKAKWMAYINAYRACCLFVLLVGLPILLINIIIGTHGGIYDSRMNI